MIVWDALTGQILTVQSSTEGTLDPKEIKHRAEILHHVNPCCFSPVDDCIASGTETGEVILWDVTGVQVSRLITSLLSTLLPL